MSLVAEEATLLEKSSHFRTFQRSRIGLTNKTVHLSSLFGGFDVELFKNESFRQTFVFAVQNCSGFCQATRAVHARLRSACMQNSDAFLLFVWHLLDKLLRPLERSLANL
jgi:hypothetical protein